MDIHILDKKIDEKDLKHLVDHYFKDMVKFVVDIEKEIVAIGGELHADAEKLLLDKGCQQRNLWGANYLPDKEENSCIEYTALVNIRPSQGNPSMEIMDHDIRKKVKEIAFRLIGRGNKI